MSKPLHILHVTASISHKGGGVASFLWWLIGGQIAEGHTVSVAGLQDEYVARDIEKYRKSVNIATAPPTFFRSLGWSISLRKDLKKMVKGCDLIHIHGIRTLLHHDVQLIAAQFNKPIITSPHGQLYPQVLQRNILLKKMTSTLFMNADLKASKIIHVTSNQEAGFVKQYIPSLPTHVIPIGIDSNKYIVDSRKAKNSVVQNYCELEGKRILLFLSLLHPKKGLLKLAEIWGELSQKYNNWHLVIAGPDDGAEDMAKAAFNNNAKTDSVTWVGPVYDRDKIDLLTAAELFILPTDWENFGIVILESLAAGTPVITTNATPWEILEEKQCGWCVPSDYDRLHGALNSALSHTKDDLALMGEKGRMLVKDRFESRDCINSFFDLYNDTLSN